MRTRQTKRPGLRASDWTHNRLWVEALAMAATVEAEKLMGFQVTDVSAKKLGYDLLSVAEDTRRHIEVKGRHYHVETIELTRHEINVGVDLGDKWIIALALIDPYQAVKAYPPLIRYYRCPFTSPLHLGVESVQFEIAHLEEITLDWRDYTPE